VESNLAPIKTGKTAQTAKAAPVAVQGDQKTDNETAKKERIKDMTSVRVDTGNGQITKFSDGNFEY
jgi:hypothetical protein